MDARAAANAIAPLVAATQGWDAEATKVYVAQLSRLADPTILRHAADTVARTWTNTFARPPLAVILQNYEAESRRRSMAALETSTEQPCDFARGIEIARDNYAAECRLQGREPDWEYFNSMFGSALRAATSRSTVPPGERGTDGSAVT